MRPWIRRPSWVRRRWQSTLRRMRRRTILRRHSSGWLTTSKKLDEGGAREVERGGGGDADGELTDGCGRGRDRRRRDPKRKRKADAKRTSAAYAIKHRRAAAKLACTRGGASESKAKGIKCGAGGSIADSAGFARIVRHKIAGDPPSAASSSSIVRPVAPQTNDGDGGFRLLKPKRLQLQR